MFLGGTPWEEYKLFDVTSKVESWNYDITIEFFSFKCEYGPSTSHDIPLLFFGNPAGQGKKWFLTSLRPS